MKKVSHARSYISQTSQVHLSTNRRSSFKNQSQTLCLGIWAKLGVTQNAVHHEQHILNPLQRRKSWTHQKTYAQWALRKMSKWQHSKCHRTNLTSVDPRSSHYQSKGSPHDDSHETRCRSKYSSRLVTFPKVSNSIVDHLVRWVLIDTLMFHWARALARSAVTLSQHCIVVSHMTCRV